MSEEKLKGIPSILAKGYPLFLPHILALYFGPDSGPIFWPGLRPYIAAPNAALYLRRKKRHSCSTHTHPRPHFN